MARQALYRKWRSRTFDEIIGQTHVTQTLKNALDTGRVGHAYLFTGPRGTGKTSTARLLAKAVNCLGEGEKPCNQCSICQAVNEGRLMDLIEIDAASNTSVDDIRDLRDKVDFRPSEAQIKFYIIDEVHMLSKSAFNALLKTLEEPPPHVAFVLATTEPERIPATILSRCQRFDFKRIRAEAVAERLRFIVDQEDLQAEPAALTYIARQGGGSMRDAISLLDQLTAYGSDIITLELVRSVLGAVNAASIEAFVRALIASDVLAGLALIHQVVNDGLDPRQFALETLEYLRSLLLVKHGQGEETLNLPVETVETMRDLVQDLSGIRLLEMTQRFNEAVKDFKLSSGDVIIPQLPLELAFIELTTGERKQIIHAQQSDDMGPAEVSTQPVTRKQATRQNLQDNLERPVAATAPIAHTTPASSPPHTVETPNNNLKEGELSKDQLRQYWPSIINKLRMPYREYLTTKYMDDVEIQGQTIHLYFKPAFRTAAERAEKSLEIIQKPFQDVLGQAWYVECHVQPKAAKQVQQVDSPQQNVPERVQEQTNSSTSLSEQKYLPEDDPIIQAALRLGGKIDSIETE